uniref:Uncharacterized protein LOC102807188 n=1 Tax=Saccoglossus kowalevskii TaxID=10224 RepID=A0ABM0MG75_SACKO
VPTDCPDFAPPCDEKCVSNNTYACNRECLCKPGWTGITCNETIPTTSTISGTQSINVELISSVESSLSTNPASYSILATKSPLISETGSAGVLAGFVILAIVIVILIGGSIVCIVFIYRRRTRKPTSLHVDEAAGGLEMTEPRHIQEKGLVYQDVDQENSYSEVNFSHSNPTYELNDNGGEKNNLKCEIYAQPSRNVKSNPGNEDIDETDNPYTEMKQRYQMPRSIKDRNVGSTDSLPETNDSTLPSAWEARDTGTDEPRYDIPSSRQNTISTSDVSLVGNSVSGQPEGYMAMGGSQDNTPRSVKTRFAGDGEDWYKSPRPLPSYAVISDRKPSSGEYSKINDKDNMYNTVDRTGRSYKNEGGPQTEYAHLGTDEEDKTEAYDKLDRLKKMSHLPGNQIVSDSSYDKIGQNENTDDDSEDIPTSPVYDHIGIDAKAGSDQIDKCPMSPQYDVPRATHDVDDSKDKDQTNGATSDDVPVSHNNHNNPNVNSESDENNQYDVPRHYSNKII